MGIRLSLKVPSCQVVVIGILLGFLDSIGQLAFVVLVDKFASLLPLICDQPGVSPLFWHGPDLYRFAFGGRNQPVPVWNVVNSGDLGVKSLQEI